MDHKKRLMALERRAAVNEPTIITVVYEDATTGETHPAYTVTLKPGQQPEVQSDANAEKL